MNLGLFLLKTRFRLYHKMNYNSTLKPTLAESVFSLRKIVLTYVPNKISGITQV